MPSVLTIDKLVQCVRLWLKNWPRQGRVWKRAVRCREKSRQKERLHRAPIIFCKQLALRKQLPSSVRCWACDMGRQAPFTEHGVSPPHRCSGPRGPATSHPILWRDCARHTHLSVKTGHTHANTGSTVVHFGCSPPLPSSGLETREDRWQVMQGLRFLVFGLLKLAPLVSAEWRHHPEMMHEMGKNGNICPECLGHRSSRHKFTQRMVLSVHSASPQVRWTAIGHANWQSQSRWGPLSLLGCRVIWIFESPALLPTYPPTPTPLEPTLLPAGLVLREGLPKYPVFHLCAPFPSFYLCAQAFLTPPVCSGSLWKGGRVGMGSWNGLFISNAQLIQ